MRWHIRVTRRRSALVMGQLLLAVVLTAQSPGENGMLLDDFSRTDGRSAVDTRWEGFTDRVMGGRSDMSSGIVQTTDGPALHMTGQVTTENNGGFIQVRLPLSESGLFDASQYRGVALTVRGRGDNYYVHLRTRRTRMPWAHYAQKLPVTEAWQRVELPFDAFEGELTVGRRPVDTDRLRSVAVVAAKADFRADIQVRDIAFY